MQAWSCFFLKAIVRWGEGAGILWLLIVETGMSTFAPPQPAYPYGIPANWQTSISDTLTLSQKTVPNQATRGYASRPIKQSFSHGEKQCEK
jgi:hypothetical protein